MLNWSTVNDFDLKTINLIKTLLKNHPKLLLFIFNQKKPQLRTSSSIILEEALAFSSGEIILVKLALDLWDRSGNSKFMDVIDLLSNENLLQVQKAFSLNFE